MFYLCSLPAFQGFACLLKAVDGIKFAPVVISSFSFVFDLCVSRFQADPEKDLGRFVLAPGLIYANALDLVACNMEMAVISGRNAALLVTEDLL